MTLPLIVNPAAGGGRARTLIPGVVARLRAAGYTPIVHETTGPGDATQIAARLAAEGCAKIACAGGDGTSFEVLNGLFPRAPDAPRPALLAIPLGTGNSFLRDFGVTSTEAALDAIAAGRRRVVDVVRADHTDGSFVLLNLISLGFVSEVGALTNRRFKPLGAAGYTVATVLGVARLRHVVLPIRLDGGPTDARPCVFLSFNNSRYTGGTMEMAPGADPSDGLLDVIRVGPMGRLELLATFPKIYQGRHLEHPLNEAARARQVDFDLPGPVDLMVDGEVLRHQLTRLTVLPGALEVCA
jgi:diacylglycerol kinase (ATP)